MNFGGIIDGPRTIIPDQIKAYANYDSEVRKALNLAQKAHWGQRRWGGEPYITHPIAVANLVEGVRDVVVALLHDVVEDTPTTLDDLRAMGFHKVTVLAVDAITKRDGEDYLEYLDRVMQNSIASLVKLADLHHNLSNMKKGSMRDKYRLADRMIREKYGLLGVDFPLSSDIIREQRRDAGMAS